MIEQAIIDAILKHKNVYNAYFCDSNSLIVWSISRKLSRYKILGITNEYYSVRDYFGNPIPSLSIHLDIKDPNFFKTLTDIIKNLK